MAKQLSMEDLIKKYQYLKTNRQTSPRTETNQKSHEKDRTWDDEYSSKIIFMLIVSINNIFFLFYIESTSRSYDGKGASARPMSAAESSKELTSEDVCKVCLDAEANCAFIECGHIVSCLNCAKLLTRCPICRETIKRTLRVYKS